MNNKLYSLFDDITESELEELDLTDISLHKNLRRRKRIMSSVMGKLSGSVNCEKRSHISKKVFVALIAAAILAAGSVGVYSGYQLSQGIYDGIQYSLPYYTTKEDAAVLSAVTTPLDATAISNTYNNISFKFEGVVSDTTKKHIILTASRTDGKKFSDKKGSYMAVLEVQYSYKPDESNINGYEADDVINLFNISVTKDGNLAMDITCYDDVLEGYYYSYRYKIKNIYQLPRESISQKLSFIYGDLSEEKTTYDKYESALKDYALKTYEGSFEFSCELPEDDGVIKLYDKKSDLNIAISSLSFEMVGSGLDPYINRDGVTFKFKDGSSETYMVDSRDLSTIGAQPRVIGKFNKPVDPYLITEITVCGNTIKIPLYQSNSY